MFEVNDKNIRIYFTPFCTVPVVDFEQANVSGVLADLLLVYANFVCKQTQIHKCSEIINFDTTKELNKVSLIAENVLILLKNNNLHPHLCCTDFCFIWKLKFSHGHSQ